jgi:hypothetical protein
VSGSKKYNAAYYARHREKYLARARAQRAAPGGAEKAKGYRTRYKRTKKGRATALRATKRYLDTPRGRFTTYQYEAKDRGLPFTLTFDEFKTFWQKPCAYCRAPVALIGLDRVDNAIGYVFHNVVSCCSVCNRMKMNWSREFFVAQCWKIVLIDGGLA